MNGLAALLRQRQSAGKQLLFIYAEEVFLREFIAPRTCAANNTKVQDHNILLAGIDSVQHRCQIIKCIGVPDHHERIPGANAQSGSGQFPTEKLRGTRKSRFPGCLYRKTNTASPFIEKLHITPNAYASPRTKISPR